MAYFVLEVGILSRVAITFHVQTQESMVCILWIHGPMIGRPLKQTVKMRTNPTCSDLNTSTACSTMFGSFVQKQHWTEDGRTLSEFC